MSLVTLAATNLLYMTGDPLGSVQDLLAQAPDVVAASEVTPQVDHLLRRELPYRIVDEQWMTGHLFSQGVYSHLPIEPLPRVDGIRGQVVRVRVHASEPFVLWSVHLYRPTFHRHGSPYLSTFLQHWSAVRELARQVEAEQEPTVLAGDLNLAPLMPGYLRLVRRRTDAVRAGGGAAGTYVDGWPWKALRLRIDHITIPRTWSATDARTFRLRGSDHRGILANIGPAAT